MNVTAVESRGVAGSGLVITAFIASKSSSPMVSTVVSVVPKTAPSVGLLNVRFTVSEDYNSLSLIMFISKVLGVSSPNAQDRVPLVAV